METVEVTHYWLTRFCFQRFLGSIYLIGFLIVVNQIHPLIGERGLLPAKLFLQKVGFWDTPSLFWFHCSDKAFSIVGWSGVVLSVTALTGISERFGIFVSVAVWALLWLFYLSFVNVGQTFYGFGWETLLLETGFLAIFLGSSETAPPTTIIWLIRWILFRVIFGAGLIKLRGDACWRDLTCMLYHYETQPLPNPLSWSFHHLPPFIHKAEILFTHFIELVAPWGLFIPGMAGYVAGAFQILFQILLILSGNLSWLNYITLVLCIACFDDKILSKWIPVQIPETVSIAPLHQGIAILLTAFILLLSIQPVLNMISPRQIMNRSFEPFHLVNTYGAFGSVTKERMEIVFQGTAEPDPETAANWREYEFKAKPGSVSRRPAVVSPYHYRLDWQMWFAAMSSFRYHPWILNLAAKLLKGDPGALSLLAHNPFPNAPPKYLRAELYHYRFTTAEERKKSGHWWKRTYVREYLPPLSLDNAAYQEILRDQGWWDEAR
jgi:hypothetical protein